MEEHMRKPVKKTIRFSFFPVVREKSAGCGFPLLNMEEPEFNILLKLCEEGPKSIYDLWRTNFLLQQKWPKHVQNNLSDFTPKQAEELRKDLHKPRTYSRSSIYCALKKLSDRNFVKTHKETRGPRIRNIVTPTFCGLMFYLQNPFEEEKWKSIRNRESYAKMIPVAEEWDSIVTALEKERCLERLRLTAEDFVEVQKARFQIKPLKMNFDGFLESPRMLLRELPKAETTREMDTQVGQYLEKKEAELLRNSFIAYLALNDIEKLSLTEKKNVDTVLTDLESEKELAYFESRQLSTSNSLFKGGRLKEFLPKYSGIEYFFTGMFVNNLLWNKRKVERPREYTDEFGVEYL